MAHYEIIVQSSSGRPMRKQRVSLFGGGDLTSGFSDEEWTNDDGTVVLEHSARRVDVYVGGKKVSTGVSPGRHVVTL